MRKLATVVAGCLCLGQATFTGAARAETVPPGPGVATGAGARFLRAEPSLWDAFGVKLSRDGKQVGPSFLSVIPDEAVAGSTEAARHVRHARVLHAVVLGFTLTSLGLIVGSFAVASSNDEWTRGSGLMFGGGVLALFAGYGTAFSRQNEILAAVNAYNYDLVTGRLQP